MWKNIIHSIILFNDAKERFFLAESELDFALFVEERAKTELERVYVGADVDQIIEWYQNGPVKDQRACKTLKQKAVSLS